tara:strand:+ start:4113 stop:4430 length:318 start_codon:yes stop_codon:yes gene_type:complete
MRNAFLALVLFLSFSNVFAYTVIDNSNQDYLNQIKNTLTTTGFAVMCGNNGSNKNLVGEILRLGNINDNLVRLSQLVSTKFKVVNTELEHSESLASQTCLTIQLN